MIPKLANALQQFVKPLSTGKASNKGSATVGDSGTSKTGMQSTGLQTNLHLGEELAGEKHDNKANEERAKKAAAKKSQQDLEHSSQEDDPSDFLEQESSHSAQQEEERPGLRTQPRPPGSPSNSNLLLKMVNKMKQSTAYITDSVGTKSYTHSEKKKADKTKFRKGTLLDEKY